MFYPICDTIPKESPSLVLAAIFAWLAAELDVLAAIFAWLAAELDALAAIFAWLAAELDTPIN